MTTARDPGGFHLAADKRGSLELRIDGVRFHLPADPDGGRPRVPPVLPPGGIGAILSKWGAVRELDDADDGWRVFLLLSDGAAAAIGIEAAFGAGATCHFCLDGDDLHLVEESPCGSMAVTRRGSSPAVVAPGGRSDRFGSDAVDAVTALYARTAPLPAVAVARAQDLLEGGILDGYRPDPPQGWSAAVLASLESAEPGFVHAEAVIDLVAPDTAAAERLACSREGLRLPRESWGFNALARRCRPAVQRVVVSLSADAEGRLRRKPVHSPPNLADVVTAAVAHRAGHLVAALPVAERTAQLATSLARSGCLGMAGVFAAPACVEPALTHFVVGGEPELWDPACIDAEWLSALVPRAMSLGHSRLAYALVVMAALEDPQGARLGMLAARVPAVAAALSLDVEDDYDGLTLALVQAALHGNPEGFLRALGPVRGESDYWRSSFLAAAAPGADWIGDMAARRAKEEGPGYALPETGRRGPA